MDKLSREQIKDYCKHLYLNEKGITQKEICKRAGLEREATLSRWINEEGWERLRVSLLATRSEQLAVLYQQLQAINEAIAKREEKYPTSKDADAILKLTTAIKALEQDLNVAEKMEVGKQFLGYVRQVAPIEQSNELCRLYDGFIKSLIKS